jgi:U3 small nucleolar RNA-associated protein 14
MQRPKRACTERTKQKIQEILEWETCTEDSKMFKDVAAQMQLELESETKRDDYAPSSSSESDSESEDNCSEEDCEKKE